MKLLVTLDEYAYKKDDVYYLNERGHIFAKRFLNSFEEVIFVMRVANYQTKKLPQNVSSCMYSNLIIYEIPEFHGPKQYLKVYNKIKYLAKNIVSLFDLAIFRLPSTTGFSIWKEWLKTNKPYAVEIVFDCKDAYKSSNNIFNKILWVKLHKWQQTACFKAIGVSCVTKEHLQKNYYSKRKNSITSHYSTIELDPNFLYKPRLFTHKKVYNVIHVSNNIEYNGRKGHKELIDTLCKLKDFELSINLIFVGSDYNNGIKKLVKYASDKGVKDKIIFTGYLTKNALREKLINSDIAILPTKAEGLPRVIIEAMAVGLPCVTTPVSGNFELVDKEFLISYNDSSGFATKIKQLLLNPNIYNYQSKINFEKSKEYLSEVLNLRRAEFYTKLKDIVNQKNNNYK